MMDKPYDKDEILDSVRRAEADVAGKVDKSYIDETDTKDDKVADEVGQKFKLTIKQENFCYYIAQGLKQAEAAKRAGYKHPGSISGVLMRNPQIINKIDQIRGDILEKQKVTAEKVLGELRKIAFANYTDIFYPDGKIRPILEWPEEVRAAISSLDIKRDEESNAEILKARFLDKKQALELLGKHFKLFTEQVEIKPMVRYKHEEFKNVSDNDLLNLLRKRQTGINDQ